MKTLLTALALAFVATAQQTQPPARSHLVIVVDGLRPDLVTPDRMPRLTGLAQRGIRFNAHHSVFPTVTRVNGASFVTGSYPETHGLLGNTVYVPSADPLKGLDTGRRENLERVAQSEGHLLTAPTLSEILKSAGRSFVALGSGTTGAVYVLNDTLASGAVVHPEYARPPELQARILQKFGPAPPAATPNAARHHRIVDIYLQMILDEFHPDVTFLWLNDPDETGHARGLGAPATLESLAAVDGEIGRVEDALRATGRFDRTNILVVSDHGFSTHTGGLRLSELVQPFAKPMPDGSPDLVVAEGAIYMRGNRDERRIAAIVEALQKRPEVGAIFTRPVATTGPQGFVAGTLSYDIARWSHRRSGEILVSANWSDAANDAGVKGKTAQTGVAGHGTSSPYDVHNVLVAAGPDFREHAASDVPTANVDVAPTLLKLLGVTSPATMTGRVIAEALRNGPAPASIAVTRDTFTVKNADGSYELRAHISIAAEKRYLDYTEVVRH